MASPGKALLVRQGDYWHLAHKVRRNADPAAVARLEGTMGAYRTAETIQLSVENFISIMEARRRLGDGFAIELAPGRYLPAAALEQLNRIANGHGPMGSKHLKALCGMRLITSSSTRKNAAPPVVTADGAALLTLAR